VGALTLAPKASFYASIQFKSRLEASWAYWFDLHGQFGIRWEYEKRAFRFDDGTEYLPDFWLPDAKAWVEVKGELDDEDRHKVLSLAKEAQEKGEHVLLCGSPAGAVWGEVNAFGELAVDIPWVRCAHCDRWTVSLLVCDACGFHDVERGAFIDFRFPGSSRALGGAQTGPQPIIWRGNSMAPATVPPEWTASGLISMSRGLTVLKSSRGGIL
jgi:hypothetical protein